MIVAGIDIGSRAAKAVIMKDGAVIAATIGDTGPESVKTSCMTINSAMESTGLSLDDIDYVVATGYGRVLVPFARENISEISCHARGINWYYPSVRTILDMGGQDCKAIRCDAEGHVDDFVMNDKCAGGTGRFLEMIADVLDTRLSEIGDLALQSKTPFPSIPSAPSLPKQRPSPISGRASPAVIFWPVLTKPLLPAASICSRKYLLKRNLLLPAASPRTGEWWPK